MWSNMNKPQKPYAEWKKLGKTDITFMWNFLEKQTYRDRGKSAVFWSWKWKWRLTKNSHREHFEATEMF